MYLHVLRLLPQLSDKFTHKFILSDKFMHKFILKLITAHIYFNTFTSNYENHTCISVTIADTAMVNVPLFANFTSRRNNSSVVRSTKNSFFCTIHILPISILCNLQQCTKKLQFLRKWQIFI